MRKLSVTMQDRPRVVGGSIEMIKTGGNQPLVEFSVQIVGTINETVVQQLAELVRDKAKSMGAWGSPGTPPTKPSNSSNRFDF